MNIDRARTEPFYQFHRFHEAVSLDMRIIVASLAELRVRAERNLAAGSLTQLTPDGEPWSEQAWKHPRRPIAGAKRFVAQMGLVQVITALEDFCIGVKAEYDRFAAFKGIKVTAIDEDDEDEGEGISPRKLYGFLGWSPEALVALDPVYDYCSLVRNCIAHRSGRASKKLLKAAAAPALRDSLATWHGKTSKKALPALPTVTLNEDVTVLPRHVILASDACRRITQDANAKLVSFLGPEGMTYMAAHHSLFAKRPLKSDGEKSPEAVLNATLAGRYQVSLKSHDESSQILSRLGKWKLYKSTFEKRARP